MKVLIAESEVEVDSGTRLMELRDRIKPGADVVVLNGAPVSGDTELNEGDRVVFIRRGEVPAGDELENLLVARHTPGVHEKVKAACVGVAGLGGLGSVVAIALARIGLGKLIIADYDVIEPSNLNRQHYFIDQIGMTKTEAMAVNLKRINPYMDLETHHVRLDPYNIPEIFGGVDVLVEAFDMAESKAMLMNSFAVAFPETPLVMASGMAGYGPGNTIGVKKLSSQIYIVGDLTSGARSGCGLMAPRVGVAAHMQANTALRLLLGEEDR